MRGLAKLIPRAFVATAMTCERSKDVPRLKAGIGATNTTSSGNPTPSSPPVLPHAACVVLAIDYPSQGTQYGRSVIRHSPGTDGSAPSLISVVCYS